MLSRHGSFFHLIDSAFLALTSCQESFFVRRFISVVLPFVQKNLEKQMRRFLLSLAGILGVTVMAMAADKAEEGKPAPLVELTAASKTKGAKVNLGDFKGKKNVVLFFYPKAMTGG